MMVGTNGDGPDFSFEEEAMAFLDDGASACREWLIAGADEAGRGPWAGPVVAGAVILRADDIPPGLNDSKKLTEARREDLFGCLTEMALEGRAFIGVGLADVERIDRDNILQASLWAMGEAVAQLAVRPDFVLIDGNKLPKLSMPSRAIVKGDGRSLSIAAASVVAKVTRDRLMVQLSEQFPDYGWESNKGYGTKAHIEGLNRVGVNEHHRRSFKPIRAFIDERVG